MKTLDWGGRGKCDECSRTGQARWHVGPAKWCFQCLNENQKWGQEVETMMQKSPEELEKEFAEAQAKRA
jgi:hypothetical protein